MPLQSIGAHARAAARGRRFVYDSDAYNDDLPYYTEVRGEPWLVVPYSVAYNDARFVIPVGHASPDDFLQQLKRALDYLWDEGGSHPRMMTVGLHPRHVGQAARASALRDFLRYAQDKGEVWFARRIDIARWWNDHGRQHAAGRPGPATVETSRRRVRDEGTR